jgi:hypothetical protein
VSIYSVINPPSLTTIHAKNLGPSFNIPIEIDATIREVVSQSAQVTRFNIEEGAEINDHVILGPVELEIEGVVSDTPLTLNLNPFSTFAAGLLDLTTPPQNPVQPSDDAYNTLMWYMSQKTLLYIVSGSGRYYGSDSLTDPDGYQITRLRIPTTQQTGRALRFSLSLRKITVVLLDGTEVGNADTENSDNDDEIE